MRGKAGKKLSMIIGAVVLLIGAIALSLRLGSVNYTIDEIITNLLSSEYTITKSIILDLRVPRIIISCVVGGNLAIAGALLQTVMRNPLADPGLTGVSSGASLVAIIVMLIFPQYMMMVPIFAFIGGVIACVMVYTFAWKKGINPMRIILAGVAVNAILGGGTSLLSILYSDKIQGVLLWVNGSIASKGWSDVKMLLPYSIVGLIMALFCIRSANVLQLGDSVATNLGVNVNRKRILLSGVAVFLAAISTSVVGIIGFVGLIVPHICRMLVGSDYKYLLPMSCVGGALILLLGDTFARTIASPIELPVGVIMAVLGGPFFLYLLRRGGK